LSKNIQEIVQERIELETYIRDIFSLVHKSYEEIEPIKKLLMDKYKNDIGN
jgi:hypothetical protein